MPMPIWRASAEESECDSEARQSQGHFILETHGASVSRELRALLEPTGAIGVAELDRPVQRRSPEGVKLGSTGGRGPGPR